MGLLIVSDGVSITMALVEGARVVYEGREE